MDQIHLDPQDKLPPHPPPLGHIVNKHPPPTGQQVFAPPPPRIISGTALNHREVASRQSYRMLTSAGRNRHMGMDLTGTIK